jgi:hypothetical protein
MGIRLIDGNIAEKSSKNAASSTPRLVFVPIPKAASLWQVHTPLINLNLHSLPTAQ